MISNSKGFYSIDTSMLRCDFYDYLDGKNVPSARLGQYMEQYPWAAGVKKHLFG